MLNWFKKVVGSSNDRYIKTLHPRVAQINAHESKTSKWTDDQLRGKTAEFREKIERGASLDDLLPIVPEGGVPRKLSVKWSFWCCPWVFDSRKNNTLPFAPSQTVLGIELTVHLTVNKKL